MTVDSIEAEIQAKGLTAPRVTPQRIEEVIMEEVYFTAMQGFEGSYGGVAHLAHAIMDGKAHEPPAALGLLTFCVLVLKNGFTVTGESACVSPENFNAELGRKTARQHAVDKIWPLEGYLLREQLDQARALASTLNARLASEGGA